MLHAHRETSMLDRTRSQMEIASKRWSKLPKVMLAAAIDRFGDPEVLTMHTVPVPALDGREVLIALDTAGVGPWDAEIRAGRYVGRKPRFPLVLGTDGAGIVAAPGA